MPCALTEPDNYPDYIKRILKKIAVGNDNDLKSCACSLRSPVNDDGCLALDSNGKVGAFTKCIQTASSPDNCPWTLEEAMALNWRVRAWKFQANGIYVVDDVAKPFTSTVILTSEIEESKEEKLVCGDNIFFYDDPEFNKASEISFLYPKKIGNLYASGIHGRIRDEPKIFVYDFREYPEYGFDPEGNSVLVDFSIFGKTIPMLLYSEDPESDEVFTSATATLTPTSYWS
jgi:hypothetical protein